MRGLFVQPSASGGFRVFDIFSSIFDMIFANQTQLFVVLNRSDNIK
jgi:hypothetical protein